MEESLSSDCIVLSWQWKCYQHVKRTGLNCQQVEIFADIITLIMMNAEVINSQKKKKVESWEQYVWALSY